MIDSCALIQQTDHRSDNLGLSNALHADSTVKVHQNTRVSSIEHQTDAAIKAEIMHRLPQTSWRKNGMLQITRCILGKGTRNSLSPEIDSSLHSISVHDCRH